MKNIVLFVLDSLNYSHVKSSPVELMPFTRKLEEESIVCENMFSQAPYTEAAVMNLYCSQNVLDNGGYLYRFRDAASTIFEEMQKKNYICYFNSYQPQCFPSSLRRGVDNLFYNVGYDQGALWSYRLSYYAGLLSKSELTGQDYETLYEIFEDNFREWIKFTDDIINDDPSVSMIKTNAKDYDAPEVKRLVEKEQAAYKEDKKSYVENVLKEGTSHSFFKIPAFNQDFKIKDREKMEEIRREAEPLFKRIAKMNFRCNMHRAFGRILSNPGKKLGSFIAHPNKRNAKELAKSLYYSGNYLMDFDLKDRIAANYDSFKNAPSAKTHIDHYIDWAGRQSGEKPHFALIHVDDIHNPEIFFTYDTVDKEFVSGELKAAGELLDSLPEDYYGSVTHDLSLRYADNMIKYLYDSLREKGMLENTCIAICADHGFSFSGNPIRDSFVVNLFLENYNMPFLIYNSGSEPQHITKLCISKDIPASLCAIADGRVPECFDGYDVREGHDYPFVQIEYCGGGCPDIMRRELKLAAFDGEYFVGTLGQLQNMEESIISEIYDLKNDPGQNKNLLKKNYDEQKLKKLFAEIIRRKEKILEYYT